MRRSSEFASGWRVLTAGFLGVATGVSSLYFYSLGLFIKPMAEAFGWTRGEASLGALIGTAGAAVMALPVGRLVDRTGSARVAVASLALLGIGFAALGALTQGLTGFLAVTALVAILAAGSSPLPFTRLVVVGFHRNRGLALGLALAGTGAGAILIPALLAPFIAHHGWRAGYYALAAVILAVLPAIWLLLRGVEETAPTKPASSSIPELLGAPAFRLLGLTFFLASIAILGTVIHFVPMLTDFGFTAEQAGRTAALIGVSAIIGRIIAGALVDRLPGERVTAALLLAAGAGLAALSFGGAALAVPGALVVGLAVGMEAHLIAFFAGRYFANAVYGQAYGGLYALFLMGGAIGPGLCGYLFDRSGDYRLWLMTAASLLVLAAFIVLRLSKLAASNQTYHPTALISPGGNANRSP